MLFYKKILKKKDSFFKYALSIVFLTIGFGLSAQEPQLLKDIYPGTGFSNPYGYIVHNNKVYFGADDGENGWELWVSDGDETGTYMVKNINPSGFSSPTFLGVFDGRLYFNADDGTHGQELWVTDGTEGGTYMVKDINTTGVEDYYPAENPIVYNDKLYFSANDGVHGFELWVTDGTEDGTQMVKDINSGAADSNPVGFIHYNDKLYFGAGNDIHGRELWVTDGTEDGTHMIKDINSGLGDSAPSYFVKYDGKLFFRADDGFHGVELWATDGTEESTNMIKDINPGASGSLLRELRNFNNKIYFYAFDENEEVDIWTSDGTEENTQPLGVDNLNNSPQNFTQFNDKLFFVANGGGSPGGALWISDGTTEGTYAFIQEVSYPKSFVVDGNGQMMYFISNNENIWVTDGTIEGTTVIIPEGQDLPHIDPSIQTHSLTVFNNKIYYTACYFLDHGCEPYFIDSSLSLTEIETETVQYWPNPFTNELHIKANNPIEQINIYSLRGQNVKGFQLFSLSQTLNLSDLPVGIYFIEITTTTGKTVKKVVKK